MFQLTYRKNNLYSLGILPYNLRDVDAASSLISCFSITFKYDKPIKNLDKSGMVGNRLWLIPSKFFVVSGKAVSDVSPLNAFDESLKLAGIANCNLIMVSSILPHNAIQVEPIRIPPGSLTFAVLSKMDGTRGETISAGIAWAWEKNGEYGIVAEAHNNLSMSGIKEELTRKIFEMAKSRDIEIGEVSYRIEVLENVERSYGCVVVALVYLL